MSVPSWKNIFDAATNNDLKGVEYFLETKKIPLTSRNDDGETPAHIAAKIGNLEMLKYLLSKEVRLASVKDINGNTVLDLAAEAGALPLVKYLLDDVQVDVHRMNSLRVGSNVVHIAAEAGQLPVLKYLIEEKKLNVDTRNDLKQTPAFLAVTNRHLDVLKYLVEDCKANVTTTDLNDSNIMHMCAPNGDISVPRYLLDERKIDLDIDYRDVMGETALQRAARFNQVAFVKYLMEEKHANPNLQDLHGRGALHEAATKGNMEVIKYMVEQGADTGLEDLYNNTPLRVATDDDVIDYLKNRTKERETRYRRSLSESSLFSRLDSSALLSLVPSPAQLSRISGPEILDRRPGVGDGASSIEFFKFLAFFSGFTRVDANIRRNDRTSSLSEGIFMKMDPIALAVINSTFNFE